MEGTQFFSGTHRRIMVGSPTLQGTTRRICILIRMPLSGESVIGMPSWLGDAFTAVSKFASDMTPEVEQIADITLSFDNQKPKDALFEMPAAKVPQAELRGFHVARAGDAEEPDVELSFKAYAPYAREFWLWLGEMAGKEAFMAFPKTLGGTVAVAPAEQQELPISDDQSDEPDQAEREALAGDSNPEDEGPQPGTPEYENAVRESLGAPEPMSASPRLVRSEPPRRGSRIN